MTALNKRQRKPKAWDDSQLLSSAIAACPDPRNAEQLLELWRKGIKGTAVSPVEFDSGTSYLAYAQALALFRKRPRGHSPELECRAIDGLKNDEKVNRITSRRLSFYARHPDRMRTDVRRVLYRARAILSSVFGETVGEGTLEQVYRSARPGSGTCIGTRRVTWTSPEFKYGVFTRLVVTPEAFPYVSRLLQGAWGSSMDGVPVEICRGNKVATVPKDAFVNRTIAIEPSLNVHLQVGLGEVIAQRLRTAGGPDIRSQLANQEAARLGAMHWRDADPWCTVDLKSASNRVTVALVRLLWPAEWRAIMEDFRSPCGLLPDGETLTYSMMSSMGNGFNFPLQTATFWALARAATEYCGSAGRPLVYGDDIVVRRSACALLMEVLRFCGLSVNTDKTFVFGPFRESCGEDWHALTRVTPVYIRGRLDEATYYRLCNTYPTRASTSDTRAALRAIGKQNGYVLRGPKDPDNASGHLWSDRYPRKWVKHWQCWSYKSLRFKPLVGRGGTEVGQYCAWLAARTREAREPPRPDRSKPCAAWVEQFALASPTVAVKVTRRIDGVPRTVMVDRDKAIQRGLGTYVPTTAYAWS